MFFLLIACAPPEMDPGLILMGPDALDAGVALDIDGQDFTSSLPVQGYADEEIWVDLEGVDSLQLAPQSGELLQVWLEQDSLRYEVSVLGEEIDPDAVLVLGAGAERLAEELGLEGELGAEGLWLREPGMLTLLTDPDLPEVEAIVPLEAALEGAPSLMLETANLASPSPSISTGARGAGGLALGALGSRAGSASASSSSATSSAASSAADITKSGTLDLEQGVKLSADALALVGYYEDEAGLEYTLSMDGSLSVLGENGESMQGWFSVDGAGSVHFYLGGEGPVASFQVDENGSLFTRGHELTRLEFACIW